MGDIDQTLQDVEESLIEFEQLESVRFRLLEDRSFSIIYEAVGIKGEKKNEYIVKIMKEKFSPDVIKWYGYLEERQIKCVVPIVYSREHGYLIMHKKEMINLEKMLAGGRFQDDVADKFKQLGSLLKKLTIGQKEIFDYESYIRYLMPRIQSSTAFSARQKDFLILKIQGLLNGIRGRPVSKSLILDLDFSNIYFDENGYIVLLDLADAFLGNAYQNIAQAYLNIRFGFFNSFYNAGKRTRLLFGALWDGLNEGAPSETEFILNQCTCLINMIYFSEWQRQKTPNAVEKVQLTYYTLLYKHWLFSILKKARDAGGSVRNYTDLADTYDSKRYLSAENAFIDSLRKERLISLFDPKETMNVLDVGTGTGSGIIFLASEVRTIIGVDATTAMLSRANEKIGAYNIKNTKLAIADAANLPFKEDKFDAVVSLNFLHLFYPPRQQELFVREMKRVVKDGGEVIIEIDNALQGAFLGIFRKYFQSDIGYNWPWDIFRLGSGMRLKGVVGISLPGTKKMMRLNAHIAKGYSNLARFFPFNLFANRLLVKFEKIQRGPMGTMPIFVRWVLLSAASVVAKVIDPFKGYRYAVLSPPRVKNSRDCVFLNKSYSIEGINIVRLNNKKIVPSRFKFYYQPYGEPRLKVLREKYGLDGVVASAKGELDEMVLLRNWTRSRFKITDYQPMSEFFDALEVLDRDRHDIHQFIRGKTYSACNDFCFLYCQVLLAMGFQARAVSLLDKYFDEDRMHCVVEVWSNMFEKWILMDVYSNLYYEQNGIPMNALELHNTICSGSQDIRIVRGIQTSGDEEDNKAVFLGELLAPYKYFRVELRNDWMTNHYFRGHPRRSDKACAWWWDKNSSVWHTLSAKTDKKADLYWPLNSVEISIKLKNQPNPGLLELLFKTITPDFKYFEITIDDEKRLKSTLPLLRWDLHAGQNKLSVASVNEKGQKGPLTEIILSKG